MTKKFFSKGNEIGHCPACRGVLFRNSERKQGEWEFVMRCPHCKKDIVIKIRHNGSEQQIDELPKTPRV